MQGTSHYVHHTFIINKSIRSVKCQKTVNNSSYIFSKQSGVLVLAGCSKPKAVQFTVTVKLEAEKFWDIFPKMTKATLRFVDDSVTDK